ncbi:NADH dehydrogenase (ubiquinone) 13 kDa A subunit [Carabus blaptoides fortunei]
MPVLPTHAIDKEQFTKFTVTDRVDQVKMSCIKLFSNLTNKTVLQNTIIRSGVTGLRAKSSSQPDWVPKDPITHTGEKWAEDDYRLARFVDRPKQVNPNFAIDLIAQVPPKECKERVVWCDGGDDHTGHPRVYINLDKPGNHICGYCGLRFVKAEGHH